MPNLKQYLKWGIREQILSIAVLGIVLSVGITQYIDHLNFSRHLVQSTGEDIEIIGEKTTALVLGRIDNEMDVLRNVRLTKRIREALNRANQANQLLSLTTLDQNILQLDQAWIGNDPSIEPLVDSIQHSEVSDYLRQMRQIHPGDLEIFVTDQAGLNIAMTARTSDYWQGDEPWWQTARAGKEYYSSPVFDASTQRWVINLALPIFEDEEVGPVIGVARTTVDITTMMNSIFEIQFGKTGQGMLVGANHEVYRLVDRELVVHSAPATFVPLLAVDRPGWEVVDKGVDDRPAILSFHDIAIGGFEIGWIVVSVEQSELDEMLLDSLQDHLITATVLVVVLGLFSLLTSNGILRVLQVLKNDAYALGVGDYSHSFSAEIASSPDPDIHSLMESFNQMKTAVQQRERALRASEEKHRLLVETMGEGLLMVDKQEHIVFMNPKFSELVGYAQEEILGQSIRAFMPDEAKAAYQAHWLERTQGQSRVYETQLRHRDGRVIPVSVTPRVLFDEAGVFAGSLGVVTDISERQAAERSMKSKLALLASLRQLDQTILIETSIEDLAQTVLQQIRERLKPDHVALYLFDSERRVFSSGMAYAAGDIFTCAPEDVDEEVLFLHARAAEPRLFTEMANEHIIYTPFRAGAARAVYSAPVRVRGAAKGLLEFVFFEPAVLNEEWLGFFESLLAQTALGIDKIELLGDLQHRNLALEQAYDSAIKGWSMALELRDEETKGHSDRVVEYAVRLATQYGFSGKDLVDFRVGALLHDIGKMGVPDSILLKPGPLDEAEWKIMRKHPEFAYQLLFSVPFLRDAIEIPYYHHERWNGTGYPHGLAGEDIPLAARIFAVVDVWDALTSDRPYRRAWTPAAGRDYLIQNSGVLFDPDVVTKFIQLLD